MSSKRLEKKLYVIFGCRANEEPNCESGRVFSAATEDQILDEVRAYTEEWSVNEDEIRIHELGRQGILPKRTITFI
jgi:hypothetical protein